MKSFFIDKSQDTEDFYKAYHNRDKADWDRIYEKYTAAVDWPTATFYKELIVQYPEAVVILTVRDADSWYKSMKNTVANDAKKEEEMKIPMLQRFHKMAYDVCGEGEPLNPVKFADEEKTKKFFIDHIEEVKRHVPAARLLVLELGEGWDRLCSFLGKDVPDTPYPSTNATKDWNK